MKELPWSDCKVAFGCEEPDALNEEFEKELPPGWSLDEFDSAGARSVVVFCVEGMLRVRDGKRVEGLIRDYERE